MWSRSKARDFSRIVVTHPSTLFHNGLRHLFAKSRFRPVRIATSLNEELKK